MKQLLKSSAAPATVLLASFLTALVTPTPATAYEYCRKDVTSSIVDCSFDTLEQCQTTSLGRGGDCFRDPFLPSRDSLAYAPKPQGKSPRRSTRAQ